MFIGCNFVHRMNFVCSQDVIISNMVPENDIFQSNILIFVMRGVRCSSVVEHPLMVQWIVSSHSNQFSTTGVTSCGMCYPVYRMVQKKNPMLLMEKSSLCSDSSRFPLSHAI